MWVCVGVQTHVWGWDGAEGMGWCPGTSPRACAHTQVCSCACTFARASLPLCPCTRVCVMVHALGLCVQPGAWGHPPSPLFLLCQQPSPTALAPSPPPTLLSPRTPTPHPPVTPGRREPAAQGLYCCSGTSLAPGHGDGGDAGARRRGGGRRGDGGRAGAAAFSPRSINKARALQQQLEGGAQMLPPTRSGAPRGGEGGPGREGRRARSTPHGPGAGGMCVCARACVCKGVRGSARHVWGHA